MSFATARSALTTSHSASAAEPPRDVTANYEYDDVAARRSGWRCRWRNGACVVLVTGNVIGMDRKAEFIVDELANYPAVETCYVRRMPNVVTPFSRILVTPDGERSRIAYFYDQTPKDELTQAMMQQGRVLSVDAYGRGEHDRAAAVGACIRAAGGSPRTQSGRNLLAGLSDVVVISSVYLQANFPGVFEYDHTLELQAMGAGIVIITDGPRPVLVVRADGSFFDVDPIRWNG